MTPASMSVAESCRVGLTKTRLQQHDHMNPQAKGRPPTRPGTFGHPRSLDRPPAARYWRHPSLIYNSVKWIPQMVRYLDLGPVMSLEYWVASGYGTNECGPGTPRAARRG